MKKMIAWMLCLAVLLTATGSLAATPTPAAGTPAPAVTTPTPAAAKSTPAAEATPMPVAAEETDAETAAHKPTYGEKLSMEVDKDGFSGEIAYPTGFEPLDAEIEKWAGETMKAYEKRGLAEKADLDGMKAELHVEYNSYELNGRFVGVKELGTYTPSASKSVELLLYTVNYDSLTEKVLTLNDIIGKQHQQKVSALLSEYLTQAGKTDLLGNGGKLMEHFLLTETGLSFLYLDGVGFYKCTLPYDAIADYLVLGSADATAAPSITPEVATKPAIVGEALCIRNGAHVRAEAKIHSTTLAVLQSGATLEVTAFDEGTNFTQVWYNGAVAYVRTSFLSIEDAVPGQTPEVTETGYSTSDGVHVRAQASIKAKRLGTLSYGEQISIIEPYYNDSWHQVLYKGRVAYVSAQYISIGTAPAVTPKPTQIEPDVVVYEPSIEFVGTCSTNGVIVRSDTSIHSDYYAKLYAGEEVAVVESEYRRGWDKVWIPYIGSRGYIGFVHSKYLSDASQVVPVVQVTATPVPVVPVVQVTPTPVPVIPVITATPIPVITSRPTVGNPQLGTGAGPQIGIPDHIIGTGVTVNP